MAVPMQWLDNGTVLFVGQEATWNIYTARPDEPGSAIALLEADFNEHYPRVSPDGRWMAYLSDESGTFQLYVRAYPGMGSKLQVSDEDLGTVATAGGATWSLDGQEITYVQQRENQPAQARGKTLDFTSGIAVVSDRELPWAVDGIFEIEDLHPDGERVLRFRQATRDTADATERPTRLIVVTNWSSELRALLGQSGGR